MTAAGTNQIIWPLANKLFTTMALLQQRPRATGGLKVVLLPTLPWDDADRPPTISYGIFEGSPTVGQTAPTNFGLAALGNPSVPLNNFIHSPRPSRFSEQNSEPSCVHPLPIPADVNTLSGTTLDETGAPLAGCIVHLLRMVPGDRPSIEGVTTSDASGNYSFNVNPTSNYWIVDYKLGTPDKAGATVTTLTGI